MPSERVEQSREQLKTEYFDISPEADPNLKGKDVFEIYEHDGVPMTYIARNGLNRQSKPGRGYIVILNISDRGCAKIREIIGSAQTMKDAKTALTESNIITWDKARNKD